MYSETDGQAQTEE
jgi:hypothetical protein